MLVFWEHSILMQLPEIPKVNIYFLLQNCWKLRKYYPPCIDKSGKGKDYNSQRSRIRCLTPEDVETANCWALEHFCLPSIQGMMPWQKVAQWHQLHLVPKILWEIASFGDSLENSETHSSPFSLIQDTRFWCAPWKGLHKNFLLLFSNFPVPTRFSASQI